MTEPRERDELDDYLGGESAVTRAYRDAARTEPPAALDARIRAAAAEAVTARRSGFERWRVPLAAAAAVVVSVTVALLIEREAPPPGIPPAADEYSAPPAPPPPDSKAPEAPRSEAAPEAGRQILPAPAATPEKREAPPAAPAVPPAPATQTAPALERAGPPAAPQPRGTLPAEAPPALRSAPAGPGEEAMQRDSASGEQPRERAAPAPRTLMKPAPAGAAIDPQTPRDPDAWIQSIRELVRAGRLDDARAELDRLVRAHPDHPLPPDLAALR